MKYKIKIFFLLSTIALSGLSLTSCSRGSGCPAETANVKPDRKGHYGAKRGNSNLFPKDMRKKVKVN